MNNITIHDFLFSLSKADSTLRSIGKRVDITKFMQEFRAQINIDGSYKHGQRVRQQRVREARQ